MLCPFTVSSRLAVGDGLQSHCPSDCSGTRASVPLHQTRAYLLSTDHVQLSGAPALCLPGLPVLCNTKINGGRDNSRWDHLIRQKEGRRCQQRGEAKTYAGTCRRFGLIRKTEEFSPSIQVAMAETGPGKESRSLLCHAISEHDPIPHTATLNTITASCSTPSSSSLQLAIRPDGRNWQQATTHTCLSPRTFPAHSQLSMHARTLRSGSRWVVIGRVMGTWSAV